MPIVPGSSTKLNRLVGISKILFVSDAEFVTYGNKIFESGMLIRNSSNQLLLTDGITKLNALQPVVDKVYTNAEKSFVQSTIANGKIDASYLSDYIENGQIKLDVLPAQVKGRISYYANYAAMIAGVTEEQKSIGAFFVIDASDDPSGTVESGSAMYGWVPAVGTEGQPGYKAGYFQKIAEVESLDIDLAALTPSADNLEAAGAVMYSHTIIFDSPTLSDLAELSEMGGNIEEQNP